MQIVLANGRVLASDVIVSVILRTDCVPVPVSVEMQLILDEEIDGQLQENALFTIAEKLYEMRIVKRTVHESGIIRDDKQVILGAYIGILNGAERLIEPTSKAIFLKDTSIGQALRASGNKIKIGEDVPLLKYLCALGETPTFQIARGLGEEAAVMFCSREAKIDIMRLSKVMDRKPRFDIPKTAVQWITNSAVLNHELKTYQTVNADGSTVEGEFKSGKTTAFAPNKDPRRLKNLSTALVTRGTHTRSLYIDMNAGDIVSIGEDQTMLILTAVHRYDSGVLGDPSVSVTKLYLAEVVTV